MHYVKDIFEGKETQHAHNKFIRYSKGKFVGPLLKIKFSKSGVKVNGSFHFVDEFLFLIAEILDNREVHIKGSLVWNQDLTEQLAKLGIMYSKVTKSRGIFKYVLENDVKFRDFVETMSGYNLLVTVKEPEVSLVSKASFPKPNKEFTADFCKTNFPADFASRIMEEFAFDIDAKNVKQIEIKHEIFVEDIELPDVDNFEEARILAKRVGTIKRYITFDGSEEKVTEIKFKV